MRWWTWLSSLWAVQETLEPLGYQSFCPMTLDTMLHRLLPSISPSDSTLLVDQYFPISRYSSVSELLQDRFDYVLAEDTGTGFAAWQKDWILVHLMGAFPVNVDKVVDNIVLLSLLCMDDWITLADYTELLGRHVPALGRQRVHYSNIPLHPHRHCILDNLDVEDERLEHLENAMETWERRKAYYIDVQFQRKLRPRDPVLNRILELYYEGGSTGDFVAKAVELCRRNTRGLALTARWTPALGLVQEYRIEDKVLRFTLKQQTYRSMHTFSWEADTFYRERVYKFCPVSTLADVSPMARSFP